MTTTHPTDAAADLVALGDEAWTATMAAWPLYATALGDRRYLETLPPNEAGASDRLAEGHRRLLERVEAISPDDLSEPDRVTRSALVDELAQRLGLIESGLNRWMVDPLDGAQVQFLNVASYQPLTTEAEGASAVERWRAMGPWIDRQTVGMRAAIADGLVAPRALVESVLDELDDLLDRPDETWPLFSPASADRAGWSAAALSRFRDGVATAIRDGIRPAFARQRNFLADELRPIARPDERPGLCHVPGGDSAYLRLVRAHTTLELSPEAIHAIGLEETARIDAAFADLGASVLRTTSPAETIDRLRSDPALRFSTSDQVRETAERALRRATEAIPNWFGRLPQAGCDVVVMGEHESKHSTIAYYREPAADRSRPGQYYINTTLPETRPRYEAETLAFHESVPGHHLQVAIAQELTHLPDFRRFGIVTAFVEGWGLYTERLSAEMGLYSGPMDEFGILSYDAWRVCRLVVDTGMHALGWTRREAIDFMLEHTALAENNIVNEVDRYIAIPGQALAYKLGQLELLRLRGEAEAALGGRFDIRRFHDAVLGEGAVGLETLRGLIGRWIETSRDGSAAG
ncbi:MAG TPA: DUF885 domain-containing protein [Candidatus Limnocylindrales bacterium]|nr:DUF885 domain-containing protein [Candidatus Limnocylindrales bacterium]